MTEQVVTQNTKASPYVLLLGTLWGTNLVVARFVVGQLDPLLFVGLRLALASLGFMLIYLLWRRPWLLAVKR